MGPVISCQSASNILRKQELLEREGGIPLIKCQLLKENTGLLSPGLIDVTTVPHLPDEEIFGPLFQLIRVSSLDKAIESANKTQYGLSAGLLSDDPQEYEAFYQNIKAGVINWNNPLTGASSGAPFGGIGKSGNHRPRAFMLPIIALSIASIESDQLKLPKYWDK